MRMASVVAVSALAATILGLAGPAEAQRRVERDRSERITFIDENGRTRTKITVRPRSYLDGGTEVVPGERKFTDYAFPPTYMNGSPNAIWDPTGQYRYPLPMPNYLPGYNPYAGY